MAAHQRMQPTASHYALAAADAVGWAAFQLDA